MDTIYQILDLVRHLDRHLEAVIAWMGLPLFYSTMFLVIFCETGLVVTPFLPGDSLLFALGAMAAVAGSSLSMPLLLGLLLVAAVVGDAVNYAIGWRVGPKVFSSESSRFLNKKHLLRAQEFYEKYGNKTIILARFVPIVRTFAPFVAGIGKMQYRRFVIYNIIGAVAWVSLCLFAGFYFGQIPQVHDNFELVVIGIILVSVLPMVVEFVNARRRNRREPPSGGGGSGESNGRDLAVATDLTAVRTS
jgi:membrane-associated protein